MNVELSPTSYTDFGDPGFSPADAIVFDEEPRHYFGAGVTYAF